MLKPLTTSIYYNTSTYYSASTTITSIRLIINIIIGRASSKIRLIIEILVGISIVFPIIY